MRVGATDSDGEKPAAIDLNVEALARMLASESRSRDAQIVIGWLTVERARRAGRTLVDFITGGLFGPQVRYASTRAPATPETLELARALIAQRVLPSAVIRAHVPGSWIEGKQDVTDDRIIAFQTKRKPFEGIYARVTGTNWYLYSRDKAPITIAPYKSATERLRAVPTVPAVDGVA